MLSVDYAKLFGALEWEYRKAKAKEDREGAWKRDQPLLLIGPSGAGKTEAAMEYLKTRDRGLYFSFKNVSSHLALKLFTGMYSDIFRECESWYDFFDQVEEHLGQRFYSSVVFDDVSFDTIDDSFISCLRAFLDRHKTRNVFIILIAKTAPEDVDEYTIKRLMPLSLGEISKAFPKYSDIDRMRLTVITDAQPGLLKHFNSEVSLRDNLVTLLGGYEFFSYAEKRYTDAFRAPESYSALLYGMSKGMHKLTELSDYAGYPPNKTDKYLRALIDAGLASTRRIESSDGRTRRGYYISSSYLELWIRFCMNGYASGDANELADRMLFHIATEYIPLIFRHLCCIWIKRHASGIYGHDIKCEDTGWRVQTIEDVTFDHIQRDGDRMLFIKIWDDVSETHGINDYAAIERAVTSVNKFYNSHIVLCSINRFRESMWEATKDFANAHLMETRFMMNSDVSWENGGLV